jgi:hypothetical protein
MSDKTLEQLAVDLKISSLACQAAATGLLVDAWLFDGQPTGNSEFDGLIQVMVSIRAFCDSNDNFDFYQMVNTSGEFYERIKKRAADAASSDTCLMCGADLGEDEDPPPPPLRVV